MATIISTDAVKLGPDDAGERVSAAEFAAAEFVEPFRYERVKGRLVVMSPAGSEHRGTTRIFRLELGAYWSAHRDIYTTTLLPGLKVPLNEAFLS